MGDHHEQETGLKRDFDSSRTFSSGPLLCQRFWRRREETAFKRKKIEISLVFVTIMLHVLTYVVSNKKIGIKIVLCDMSWSPLSLVPLGTAIFQFFQVYIFCYHFALLVEPSIVVTWPCNP